MVEAEEVMYIWRGIFDNMLCLAFYQNPLTKTNRGTDGLTDGGTHSCRNTRTHMKAHDY